MLGEDLCAHAAFRTEGTPRLVVQPRLWGSNPLLLDWESNPYHFPKGLLVVVVLSLVACA